MIALRRLAISAAVIVASVAVLPGRFEPAPARAGPGLLVGVDDDTLKWSWPGWRFIAAYEDLGFSAIRVTLRWRPGQTSLDHLAQLHLDRVTNAVMNRNRVVLAIYGGPATAPATPEERDVYCEFVVDALRRAPSVHDVVIWNEANSPSFWLPQQGAAAAYGALLARCHDVVHGSLRRQVNLIASTAPRHDPRSFIRGLGEAYRASGRERRLFDTFGHNPYPATNAEPPFAEHAGSRMLGQGDYAALLGALTSAFEETAQPVPGRGNVMIWYLENGFETAVPAERIGRYTGRELAPKVVQPRAVSARNVEAARDQVSQLRDAVELAYCQPAVGAFFNFQLVDEESLGGWQSGLLWADGSRKPSYGPFKAALADVAEGNVDCDRFPSKTRGADPAAGGLPLLSSEACCEQSSSTSTSRSRARART